MDFALRHSICGILDAITIIGWVVGAITIVVHLALMRGVYLDAKNLAKDGTGVIFTAPGYWALAVLVTGLFGLTVYWVVHHSQFRRSEPAPGNPAPHAIAKTCDENRGTDETTEAGERTPWW